MRRQCFSSVGIQGSEADTCRKYVVPGQQAAGREARPHAINGESLPEFGFTTGIKRDLSDFPTPADLWARPHRAGGPENDGIAERLLAPELPDCARPLRCNQEIAVNRADLQKRGRALLMLCADGLRREQEAFFARFDLDTHRILDADIQRYTEHGSARIRVLVEIDLRSAYRRPVLP